MSTLVVTNISDGTISVPANFMTEGVPKGYGVVNQTGVQTLNDGFNVASITDTGTGTTRFNWSNNMAPGNYARTTEGNRTSFNQSGVYPTGQTTTYADLQSYQAAAGTDVSHVNIIACGDLA